MSTLRQVRQALVPCQLKVVVFKPRVPRARCVALFNVRGMVGQRLKLHYSQQSKAAYFQIFVLSFGWMPFPFWKASATCGDVYIEFADRGGSVCGPYGLRLMD